MLHLGLTENSHHLELASRCITQVSTSKTSITTQDRHPDAYDATFNLQVLCITLIVCCVRKNIKTTNGSNTRHSLTDLYIYPYNILSTRGKMDNFTPELKEQFKE